MYSEVSFYVLLMFIESIIVYTNIFFYRYTFGIVGSNIIKNVRKNLYNSILEKNIGWFDKRENSPGILTNILGSDV
jgi:hypothetical protein